MWTGEKLCRKNSEGKIESCTLAYTNFPRWRLKSSGFINQKLPEATHINHYEDLLKSKLSAAVPKFAIKQIYPKTTSGFDVSVKTDVLGIRACKSKATPTI
jgi:hypothetical protein